MARFDDEIATALELIADAGEDATLKVMTTTANPAEPWNPGVPTEQLAPARMVFLNFNWKGAGDRYFEGTLIQTGDKKVLLAASGLTVDPNLNALVVRADNSVWKVVNFKVLDPNGQKILYTLQVRR